MSLSSHSVPVFALNPRLPGDKSITHRGYLLGALASGETSIAGGNRGRDCRATLDALGCLGVSWTETEDAVVMEGCGGAFTAPRVPLDLGNSGTGLRLLLGVLAGQDMTTTLTGDPSLRQRPMERVLAPLRRMGARTTTTGDHPPITLTGGPLAGVRHRMAVPSAQVKSALLLAGLQASGTTRIEGGRGARDHTERMLRAFGAQLHEEPDSVEISGPQDLTGTRIQVPGDPSAAMFYALATGVVSGSQVTLENVSLNPTRTSGFTAMERLGLVVKRSPGSDWGNEPQGRVKIEGRGMEGRVFPESEVPAMIDELPVIAVAAAFARGETRIQGAGELRFKESNRLATVAAGLSAIGASVQLLDDGWIIQGSGGGELPGGRVASKGDHRIAMAFLIAGMHCREGVEIVDTHGIETSDPLFMENLNQLLGRTA